MNKARLLKTTLCLAATLLVSTTVNVRAAAINTDAAMAGITLSLDKYYTAKAVEKTMETITNENMNMLSLDSIGGEEIIDDNSSVEVVSNIEEEEEEVKPEVKIISPYENIGISIANDYVNIRSEANQDSEKLGKLYSGSSATILETLGDWVKIKSGKVEGYILSSYLVIGEEAEKVAEQYGTKLATVTTTTLKVREEQSADSTILTLIPEGEEYEVVKEYDEWVKIQIDEDLTGYVSKEYVDMFVEFGKAISVEEEEAILAAEEEGRRAEEEAIARSEAAIKEANEKKAQEVKNAEAKKKKETTKTSSAQSSSTEKTTSSEPTKVETPQSTSSSTSEIVSYAKKFLGNRYVYGGTSLTGGTDCSGFTMSIYKHFGININRTSRDQSSNGTAVSFDSLKEGDLIFYTGSGGSINHVAMYIGGGQVIHASNRRDGIKISNINYRTPYKARRIKN